MTKKLNYLFIAMLLGAMFVVPAHAQDDDDSEPVELHLFRGGYMDLNFGLDLNMVGSSLGSGSMGGLMTSRIYNGALNVNLNPAMLAFEKKGQVIFDSRVGIGSNITPGINDEIVGTINDEIASAIDEEFAKEDSWTQFPETYIKPTEVRDFDAGLNGRLASLAFAAPVHDRVVIGGSFHYPAAINFDLGVTGISAKLAQEQGTDEVAIRFDVLMNISLLTRMRFEMSKISSGIGVKILETPTQRLAIGATFSRYQVDNMRRLQADMSGMVVVGGADERYFNNPNDPNLNFAEGETNAFFMNAYGNYRSTEMGYKVGATYQLNQRFNFSLVYDHVPTFDLESKTATANTYLPIFIVGSGKDIMNGDIEVALDSLQANKPNLTTERNIGDLVDNGQLKLPSSLKFGVDIGLGKHTMVLNYTNFMNEFSFTHGGNTIGKDLQHGIGFGMDFKMRDRFESWGQLASIPIRLLFLDIDGILFQSLGKFTGYKDSHYRFGGSVLLGDGISTMDDSDDLQSTLGLPLPQTFSMGRQYTIFDHLNVGVTVLAVPDLVLKYSVGISF